MKKNNIRIYILSLVMLLMAQSCNKMLEVTPPNETLVEDALKTPEDVQKLLNSCYDVLANSLNGRAQLFNELLGDNLDIPLNNDDFKEIFNRTTIFFNGTTGGLLADFYICIYRVNVLDKEMGNIPGLTAAEKQRISAEAHFLRAICNFELVKLWAQPYGFTANNTHDGITIRTEPDQTPKPRNRVGEVYAQILSDLNDAAANLPDQNGFYADKNAAKALMAKVYFQMNDFSNAAQNADAVISSGAYQLSDSINRFDNLNSGSEYIFQLVSTGLNDNRSGAFSGNYRTNNNNIPQLRLSRELYDLIQFRSSDKRRSLVKLFNPGTENEYIGTNKFNNDFFNVPYLHLTEMMFIRAESYGELNQNLSVAVNDLNKLLERAYGSGVVVLAPQAQSTEIINTARDEKRLELFGEGIRVQDLKRRGAKGESIKIRNAPWNCNGMVIQFPVSENTVGFKMNPEGGCN